MKRGEIYRYRSGSEAVFVVVLTPDADTLLSDQVTCAVVSDDSLVVNRRSELVVQVGAPEGLTDRPYAVDLTILVTVYRGKMNGPIGRLDITKLKQVDRGLHRALGLAD